MSSPWRKVFVYLTKEFGTADHGYILDALINARNFQNTNEVVFTKKDAEEIGISRRRFEAIINDLEKAGYIARIPASKPMRFVIYDKSYTPKCTDSSSEKCTKCTDSIQKCTDSTSEKVTKCTDSLQKCTDISVQNGQSIGTQCTDTTIKRKENNRELVESVNRDNNDQPDLESLIFDYFIDRGYSKAEAQKFIQYNKQRNGKDHLNHSNYQNMAQRWIDNIRRKPVRRVEKSEGRSDYKSAGMIAAERGITVEEVLDELYPDIKLTKHDPEHQFDGDEDLISVVFWEGFGEGVGEPA